MKQDPVTAPTREEKPRAEDEALRQLTQKWKDRHTAATKNQEKPFEKAKEYYELYYAQMSEKEKVTGEDGQPTWHSNAFLPLLPGKARDAKAKLSILEPRFRVTPADAWTITSTGELNFDANALNRALKVSKKLNKEFVNYTATGELPPRASLDFAHTDAIVAGWGLALAPLKVYKKIYKAHEALKDAEGNPSAYVDMKRTLTKTLLRVSTELEALDIFRVFLSPKAKSWEKSRWIIIEREESYEDLNCKNATKGEHIYNLPEGLKAARGTVGNERNKFSAVRDKAFGFNEDGSDQKDESIELFKVYDCYDQETNEFLTFVEAKLDTAVSNWSLIRRIPNPYNHGLIPLIPFHAKRRPHSPWGESFFEISKDLQYAYNAVFNQFRDNATLSTDSMALMDKNALVKGTSYKVSPGGTVYYDSLNGEKPEPWKLPDPNPATLNAQTELLEKNMENGTTPQYNSGQVNSSMDKTAGTKGGIQMLMEAANDKLSEMYRNLKGSLLRYGYISLHNAQQYQNYIEVLDTPDLSARGRAAVKNGEKASADYITPVELQDAFDLDIDDESLLPLSKSERRAMFVDFMNMLIEFQKASSTQVEMFNTPEDLLRIDWPDVVKELGDAFGELDAPAFIKPSFTTKQIAKKKIEDAKVEQEAQSEAMGVAQQADPEAEVSQDPNGITVQRQKRELSNFKDYPADVKNAVLESFGYPASQIVAQQAQAQMAEAQGQQMDTEVKKRMIAALDSGQIDPATLAKFVSK